MATLDSYSETNQDTGVQQYTGNATATGQSFTTPNDGVDYAISSVKFYLKKTGAPTGNAVAKLYIHSGTYGTSSVPTGTALATSNNYDVTALTTSYQLIEFTFPLGVVLSPNTKYIITYEHAGADSSNFTWCGADSSSPTHGGNLSYNAPGWTALSTWDACFYVYGNAATTLTSYDGSMDDTNNMVAGSKEAQGFKIAAGCTITGFSIKGSKGNTTPCTSFTAKIYEGGATPDAGTLKASQSFDSNGLGPYTASPAFQDFTFTTNTGALTGGSTQYYLIIIPDDGSGSDVIRWSIDNTSPSYADGSRWLGSWTESTTLDHNFKIFGTTPLPAGASFAFFI